MAMMRPSKYHPHRAAAYKNVNVKISKAFKMRESIKATASPIHLVIRDNYAGKCVQVRMRDDNRAAFTRRENMRTSESIISVTEHVRTHGENLSARPKFTRRGRLREGGGEEMREYKLVILHIRKALCRGEKHRMSEINNNANNKRDKIYCAWMWGYYLSET